jgi:hypothetical protein
MKSLSLRKVLKNCGQDGAVKLLPRLVSNGCGRVMAVGVSVAEAGALDADAPAFVVCARGISCVDVAIQKSLVIVMALH